MYQGERGTGARPNCRARNAMSTSDANSGSKVTTVRPAVACTFNASDATISQKVLIEQLRALEEHGMVSRQPSAGDRQGIEYLLTPLGLSLRPVLESLVEWGAHHAKELDEAHRLLPCDAVVRNRAA